MNLLLECAHAGTAWHDPSDQLTPERVVVRELRLPGDRAQVRQFASAVAVDLLRRELSGLLATHPEETP